VEIFLGQRARVVDGEHLDLDDEASLALAQLLAATVARHMEHEPHPFESRYPTRPSAACAGGERDLSFIASREESLYPSVSRFCVRVKLNPGFRGPHFRPSFSSCSARMVKK